MAAKQTAAKETLDRISLMCLDALNQARSMKEYEAWLTSIFSVANPEDADASDNDNNDD
jgi:hypothetical protein